VGTEEIWGGSPLRDRPTPNLPPTIDVTYFMRDFGKVISHGKVITENVDGTLDISLEIV
jgi:hypothetical protein